MRRLQYDPGATWLAAVPLSVPSSEYGCREFLKSQSQMLEFLEFSAAQRSANTINQPSIDTFVHDSLAAAAALPS